MSERLQQIREAVARDVSNSEAAYADRAWLLHEYDRLVTSFSDERSRMEVALVSIQIAEEREQAMRAYAVAFAQKLAECGPVEHSADEDIGLPAGIICQSCCTWAKPDGTIEHDEGCIIPKVDEFFRANPPAPALRYCDLCDGTGTYEGGAQILTKCEECEGTGTVEGEVRGGAPSDKCVHETNHQRQGADSPTSATIDPSADQDHAPARHNAQSTVGALQEATETPRVQSAPATNYIANAEVNPTRILFASGRTVELVDGRLEVGWAREEAASVFCHQSGKKFCHTCNGTKEVLYFTGNGPCPDCATDAVVDRAVAPSLLAEALCRLENAGNSGRSRSTTSTHQWRNVCESWRTCTTRSTSRAAATGVPTWARRG